MVSRDRSALSLWNLVPIAVYKGSTASLPNFCSAATHTRTGPQALARPFLYSSDRSSRPSLSTARLITCQRGATGRTLATSSIHRDVIHAHGQAGSNQKSTCTGG